jgi:LmbE family N-acetylglucosaminyl deacetylase
MQKLQPILLILFLLAVGPLCAQQPQKPNTAEIYAQVQKLNFLGSVLYIAAHPDDENTRLISYCANELHARTGYLSLTRGDGGQNLVGPELRELLGVIRTQELLEARKIDGGEQFFTRANDFGFSKNPEETLTIWEKNNVLSDVVLAIRKFRPDVIINRFDSRTAGTTHGHHTASAMLSLEAFEKADDAKAFPQQLALAKPWHPKRVFFNTSYWFYGGREKFEQADKTNLTKLQIGVYYAMAGKSNQEIAALSRSRHQSQGFGSTGTRGEEFEYLEFIKGDEPKDKTNIFDGIDTSWNRVKGGKEIGDILQSVEKSFNFGNPAASIPQLAKAYQLIQALDDDYWKNIKSEEIRKVIAAAAGLYFEAVAEKPESTPGSTVKVTLEAINRSNIPVTLVSLRAFPENKLIPQNKELKYNIANSISAEIHIPADAAYTSPYWLTERPSEGMYTVSDQSKIGMPDIIREMKLRFELSVNGVPITIDRNVIYKYNDNVKGESYQPFDIVPDVTTRIEEKVAIFNRKKSKTLAVDVAAGRDGATGTVRLELPEDWTVSPESAPFSLAKKGDQQQILFEVTSPKIAAEGTAKCIATINGEKFDRERIDINYPHISKQLVLKPSEAKLIKLNIKTGDEKIAYIMGAGDEVHKSLQQMGYTVTILKPAEITKEVLEGFDVVITGVRAYNTVPALAAKQNLLLDFVQSGKTMIVQYNTNDDFVTKDFAPYPIKISRDRVTEENASVRFLSPDNDLLNHPNKITEKDFAGWKQELGLYFPSEWDKAYTAVISANDKGETPKDGALLVAPYGKGYYIYTGLSFFRELPEGVAGAFRLMANLISTGN